jgi:hypothetical protein
MNPKKAVLLAVAAIAALALLAVPVSASAAVWKKEGVALKEKTEFKATGGEVIEVNGGVMICEGGMTMTTEGGSSAKVTGYSITNTTCSGLAGNLVGCTVSSVTPAGLPWSVTVNTSDLTAKSVKLTYAFATGCAVKKIETSFAELKLVPEPEPGAISLFSFSTSGTATVDGKAATLGWFGSFSLPESQAGKYGIG